jgi:hypothetical protein
MNVVKTSVSSYIAVSRDMDTYTDKIPADHIDPLHDPSLDTMRM